MLRLTYGDTKMAETKTFIPTRKVFRAVNEELQAELQSIAELAGDGDDAVQSIYHPSKWLTGIKGLSAGEPEFPENHSVIVYPIKERIEPAPAEGPKSEIVRIVVQAVPSLELAQADGQRGNGYIEDAFYGAIAVKLANAARALIKEGESGSSLPVSTADYFEVTRDSGLATFDALAKGVLDALAKQHKVFKMLNKNNFRKCLSSKPFAMATFQMIEQNGIFAVVLNKMIELANKDGLDPQILVDWRDNRENAQALDSASMDVTDAFAGLFADADADSDADQDGDNTPANPGDAH